MNQLFWGLYSPYLVPTVQIRLAAVAIHLQHFTLIAFSTWSFVLLYDKSNIWIVLQPIAWLQKNLSQLASIQLMAGYKRVIYRYREPPHLIKSRCVQKSGDQREGAWREYRHILFEELIYSLVQFLNQTSEIKVYWYVMPHKTWPHTLWVAGPTISEQEARKLHPMTGL